MIATPPERIPTEDIVSWLLKMMQEQDIESIKLEPQTYGPEAYTGDVVVTEERWPDLEVVAGVGSLDRLWAWSKSREITVHVVRRGFGENLKVRVTATRPLTEEETAKIEALEQETTAADAEDTKGESEMPI